MHATRRPVLSLVPFPFPNRTLLFTTRLLPFSFIFFRAPPKAEDDRTHLALSRYPAALSILFFFFSCFVHHVAALFLMPIATSPSVLPRPATFAKMEDRKRPASGAVDDYAPPSKRQAVNGSGKSKDDSGDMKEEAWIEVSVSHDSPCVVILWPSLTPFPSEDRAYAAVALMPRPSCGDSWHQTRRFCCVSLP